jgi:hypothetical protein
MVEAAREEVRDVTKGGFDVLRGTYLTRYFWT